MAHTHVNCTDVSTYLMEIRRRPEDTRDLILDTQRPIETFQKNLEALRRSVSDISDIHAVLTKIFIENDWDVSRLYQSHRLDIYRGLPGWFVNHKIERCYAQAQTTITSDRREMSSRATRKCMGIWRSATALLIRARLRWG